MMPFIIDRFEAAAAKSPDSLALLLEDGRTLSYGDLNETASRLSIVISYFLSSHAVDSSVGTPLVALLMARDVATVAAMLAVGKSQAAYVPVDPAFPPDRQSHIFSHSQCQLLIADSESYSAAASLGVIFPPTVVVEASTGKVLQWPDGGKIPPASLPLYDSSKPNARKNDSEALMYVLYTSGSTGKPKGVMVKQVGVINIVNWFAEQLGVSAASRVMCLTTFCFDISVLELYLPLICGGVSVLAKSSSQKNSFTLLDLVNSSKCTVFQATPTTYEMMFATGWNGDPSIDFLVGGEAFRPTLLPLAGNCRSLRNVYGPTETTIWSSSFTVPKSLSLTPPGTAVSIPIGSVISETVFYLVAEGKQPWTQVTGKDAEGELWIGGIGVARGYLHAPDLTEKVFLPNPFDPSLGNVYRTGDIVKKLDDGSDAFVFVRRMDDQVKIDGFRIELQEIEAVYMQHESVDKAVALVRGGNKLIIYIKPTENHASGLNKHELSQITAFASRSLTYYMVPKFTIVVDSFPQTANGKLDRKALRDPSPEDVTPKDTSLDEETKEDGSKGVGMTSKSKSKTSEAEGHKNRTSGRVTSKHRSRDERRRVQSSRTSSNLMTIHIVNVIEKVRGSRPGPHSTFAAMGVDSLGAVMFIRSLSDSLDGIKIDPTLIFTPGLTIKDFASAIEAKAAKEKPETLLKLKQKLSQVPPGSTSPDDASMNIDVSITVDDDAGDDESDEDSYDVELDPDAPTAVDKSFEELIGSNRLFLEGMRGIFAFIVMWDHYWPRKWVAVMALLADVACFVIISGFTTSLQLRQPPKFQDEVEESDGNINGENLKSGSDDPDKSLPRRPRRRLLCDRTMFNYRKFLVTRTVGIIPILWIALLIAAPFWYVQMHPTQQDLEDPKRSSFAQRHVHSRFSGDLSKVDSMCVVLYVFGLQAWDLHDCTESGPYWVFYASIILNVFILYCIMRILGNMLQTKLMSWRSKSFTLPNSSKLPIPEDIETSFRLWHNPGLTWKEYIGNLTTLLTYNRTHSLEFFLPVAAVWCFVVSGIMAIMYYHGNDFKDPLTYIGYFTSGVIFANLCECWHCYVFNRDLRNTSMQRTRSTSVTEALESHDVLQEQSLVDVVVPVAEQHPASTQNIEYLRQKFILVLKWVVNIFFSPDQTPHSDLKDSSFVKTSHNNSLTNNATNNSSVEPLPVSGIFPPCLIPTLWRFFPDFWAIGTGCLCSYLGHMNEKPQSYAMWWSGFEALTLVFIFIHFAQRGDERQNISRIFLESPIMGFLGYISYPLYIFQHTLLEWWMPYIYASYKEGHSTLRFHNAGYYDQMLFYDPLPVWAKVVAFLVVFLICWIVQKYIQDTLVVRIYTYLSSLDCTKLSAQVIKIRMQGTSDMETDATNHTSDLNENNMKSNSTLPMNQL